MLLIIFALTLLILLITIPIIWKLTTFMISFMISIPLNILNTIWNGHTPNAAIDPFWKYAANDSTAMWIKGTDGRFFRYGLNLSDEAESLQMEELNKFYRNHMNG